VSPPDTPARTLVVFLDGVGLGPSDPDVNPFLRAELPVFRELAGGEVPTLEHPQYRRGSLHPGDAAAGHLVALEANLGVDGLPQSGTGQVTLLTGDNAADLLGRHFGPWPPVRLRPLLAERNLLSRAVEAGVPTAFANAYPTGYPGTRSPRRVAAPALAAEAAGLLTRDHRALADGTAVASEIVNDGWRAYLGHTSLPQIGPREAGEVLAGIAATARLTFFAHYQTDHAGHRGGMAGAVAALERVDAFLGGVVGAIPEDTLLLVVSDHGNIEDVRTGHTRNPALGFARGAGADGVPAELSLTGVAPLVLGFLGVEPG